MIAKAAEEVAERVGAKYVVAFTKTGTPRAGCPGSGVRSRSSPSPPRGRSARACRGVETFKTQMVEHTDEMVRQVDEQLLQIGRVEEGEPGRHHRRGPPGIPGSTNALRIHRMGDAINEVAPYYRRSRPVTAWGRSARPGARRRPAARR